MDLGLNGRAALVMGGSAGIGRAIAEALEGEGASVAISSRTEGYRCDTGDLDAVAALPARVEADLGPIDILVTNTGGPPAGGALASDLNSWRAAYESLVLAPRVLIEAVLPGMVERRWGRIVNVGSTSTVEPIPGLALSNAHRMAAVGFFKTLATEVAGEGVTVNTVATGNFATDRLAQLRGSMDAAEEYAAANIPVGRLGRPEEYGDLVAFLASDRAAFLTGAVVPLDGGALHRV
jgi:3-oxoacyl-[acyl-carrier protein] reductase